MNLWSLYFKAHREWYHLQGGTYGVCMSKQVHFWGGSCGGCVWTLIMGDFISGEEAIGPVLCVKAHWLWFHFRLDSKHWGSVSKPDLSLTHCVSLMHPSALSHSLLHSPKQVISHAFAIRSGKPSYADRSTYTWVKVLSYQLSLLNGSAEVDGYYSRVELPHPSI